MLPRLQNWFHLVTENEALTQDFSGRSARTRQVPRGHPARAERTLLTFRPRGETGGSAVRSSCRGRGCPKGAARSLLVPRQARQARGELLSPAAPGSRGCGRQASVLTRSAPPCRQGSGVGRVRPWSPWPPASWSPAAPRCPREAAVRAPRPARNGHPTKPLQDVPTTGSPQQLPLCTGDAVTCGKDSRRRGAGPPANCVPSPATPWGQQASTRCLPRGSEDSTELGPWAKRGATGARMKSPGGGQSTIRGGCARA